MIGNKAETSNYKLANGSLGTEFAWDEEFHINSGYKECFAAVRLYSVNNTWQTENGCIENINSTCKCFILGITSTYKTEDVHVYTIPEFIQREGIKKQEQQKET